MVSLTVLVLDVLRSPLDIVRGKGKPLLSKHPCCQLLTLSPGFFVSGEGVPTPCSRCGDTLIVRGENPSFFLQKPYFIHGGNG